MEERQISTPTIAIIGGGLTGLSCAYHLEKEGFSPTLFEKKSRPGGRVYSDEADGFILDCGFQVILSSYPEVRKHFNLESLGCQSFDSGALINHPRKGWLPIYNPWFHPLGWMKSTVRYPRQLTAFLKILFESKRYEEDQRHWKMGILSTEELLQHLNISKELIDHFFRPFFGGVFLENELQTQAPIFMERFHDFMNGKACLPEKGMGAFPQDLANKLTKTKLLYNSEVIHIEEKLIKLASGEDYRPDVIICCLDSKTTNHFFPLIPCHPMVGVTCLYFQVDADQIKPHKLLVLGNDKGPINNLSIDSAVQPSYAPKGKHLLSATVVGEKWQHDSRLQEKVKKQIKGWMGVTPQHLHTYVIETALPTQDHPPPLLDYHHPRHEGIYLAGEVVDSASINGALLSGKKIAKKIKWDLSAPFE